MGTGAVISSRGTATVAGTATLSRLPHPEAVYLGPSHEPFLAFVHLPVVEAVGGLAAVICPPHGHEHMVSYRSFALLARRLAAGGVPALLLDWPGDGDSAGEDGVGRVESWHAAVDAACDHLRGRPGVSSLALVGIRLGATLATLAAARRDDVSRLLLWAPIAGGAYVRETQALSRLERTGLTVEPDPPATALPDGAVEAGGFVLGAETVEAMKDLDPLRASFDGCRPRTLVLGRDSLPPNAKLLARLADQGLEVGSGAGDGYGTLMRSPHASVHPESFVEQTAAFLDCGPDQGLACTPPAGPVARTAPGAEEHVAWIDGPAGNLCGIVATPASREPGAGRTWVILASAGAVRRAGTGRLYARLARRLAAAGVPSIRLDLRGIGDSDGDEVHDEDALYTADRVEDLLAAVAFACTAHGAERVVLVGQCASAYLVFHAAGEAAEVDGVVLLNPPFLAWRPGETAVVETRRYARRLRQAGGLRKLATGKVDLGRVLHVLATRAAVAARASLSRDRAEGGDDVGERLAALHARGVETDFLYCAGEQGLLELERHLGRPVSALAEPLMSVDVLAGPSHTFTPHWGQERALALVLPRLLGLASRRRPADALIV